MGQARNIFDLCLAGGAIIGIMAVASPQLLSIETNLSSMTSAQAKGSTELVEIGHFLGIAQFVKNPTDYSFVYGEQTKGVTKASLVGDRMTITYQYPSQGKTITGSLNGTVNSDGVFVGSHNTKIEKEQIKGSVQFTFLSDGTAKGFPETKANRREKSGLTLSKSQLFP